MEVNGEETFPDDEKKWEMETIEFIYPQGKAPLIQEVKRENCKFKAWTDGYQKHHAIMLENIPWTVIAFLLYRTDDTWK